MVTLEKATITWQGDMQVLLRWPDVIDPEVNREIAAIVPRLQGIEGVAEVFSGYATVAVVLSSEGLGQWEAIYHQIQVSLETPRDPKACPTRHIRVPVCYGQAYGPDLETVAAHTGLSPQAVIQRHAQGLYRVYMLGFTPGFPYLGGMDPALKTPRLKVPRLKIPAGSVGIADAQTGIYPQETPGGWQIIGRCPLGLFDLNKEEPALLRPGDTLSFVPIDIKIYNQLVEDGGESWSLT